MSVSILDNPCKMSIIFSDCVLPRYLPLVSCSKFPSFNQTLEEPDQWTHFAPIAKLESLDEIDQDSSKHSPAGAQIGLGSTAFSGSAAATPTTTTGEEKSAENLTAAGAVTK